MLFCVACAFMLWFFLLDPLSRCLLFDSKWLGNAACLRFFVSPGPPTSVLLAVFPASIQCLESPTQVCFTGILALSCASRSSLCRVFVLPLSSVAARFRFLLPAFSSTLAALQLFGSCIDRLMVSDVDLAFGSCGAYRSTSCFVRCFLKLPWKAACSGISPRVVPCAPSAST